MKEKTAKELLRRYGHQLLFAFVRIVFPTERHSSISDIDDPVVGDGNAMRITGEILENVLRSSEWSFGVNHPILTKQRSKESMENPSFGQGFQTAWKHQFV